MLGIPGYQEHSKGLAFKHFVFTEKESLFHPTPPIRLLLLLAL